MPTQNAAIWSNTQLQRMARWSHIAVSLITLYTLVSNSMSLKFLFRGLPNSLYAFGSTILSTMCFCRLNWSVKIESIFSWTKDNTSTVASSYINSRTNWSKSRIILGFSWYLENPTRLQPNGCTKLVNNGNISASNILRESLKMLLSMQYGMIRT
jgi:hypothetical protein